MPAEPSAPSSAASESATTPADWYQTRAARYESQLDAALRRDALLTQLRGWTFLPAIGLFFYGWGWSSLAWPWLIASGVLVAAFIAIVRAHERLRRSMLEAQERLAMNRLQIARIERRWDAMPAPKTAAPAGAEAVAGDLDLFGRASLFELISLAHTPIGRKTLSNWLVAPASPEEVTIRQQAARKLAPDAPLREEIDVCGRLLGASQSGTTAFLDWAQSSSWLHKRALLWGAVRVIPVAVVACFVVAIAGWVNPAWAVLALAGLVLVNIVLNIVFAGHVYGILQSVTSRSHNLEHYRPLLQTIAGLPSELEFFARLQSRLGTPPREALDQLRGLMRIVAFANLRRDGLFGILYYISQVLFLTDFFVLSRLEQWKARNGGAVAGWLDSVGELEAIASLATLAHDNPHWATAEIDKDAALLEATAIGHPLLPDAKCVRNDIAVGPAGAFTLVTGSNMSGKSTLLRSVGLNVAIAQAGAPVCAKSLRLPPLEIATSMRVHDSLAEGVSFFLAELKRLKQVVEHAIKLRSSGERTLLYLLDEILQGTNSAERHIAVARVVHHLNDNGAIGMVSTHDLELGSSAELAEHCKLIHLRETISTDEGRERMTFDYQVREGIAPTTNALRLLEMVGLGDSAAS